MWERGLQLFCENPIWGVGKLTENQWSQFIHVIGYKTQLHNQFVEYLTTGGIVLFILLLCFYVCIGNKMYLVHNTSLSYMLCIVCYSVAMAGLMEGRYNAEYYLPFFLTYYVLYIEQSHKFCESHIQLRSKQR